MTDILLYEYHGEYLQMLHDRKRRPGFAWSFMLVDFEGAEEAGLKVVISDLPDYIKDALNTYGGDESFGGFLFLVSGNINAHKSLFCEMVVELIEGPQGADDDTFDYWPGACDCLEMYATQLYKLTGDRFYINQLMDVEKNNQEVPEWEGFNLTKV